VGKERCRQAPWRHGYQRLNRRYQRRATVRAVQFGLRKERSFKAKVSRAINKLIGRAALRA
jgi:hypothetical protein